MKKNSDQKNLYFIATLIIIYTLFILFYIIPLLDIVYFISSILILIALFVMLNELQKSESFNKNNIKEPEIAPFKMNAKELTQLLKYNLKKQNYKYLYNIRKDNEFKKTFFQKKHLEGNHIINDKLIIIESNDYNENIVNIIHQEVEKCKNNNKKMMAKTSLQVIYLVNNCNLTLNKFYDSEYTFNIPSKISTIYTPFIIDKVKKRILISGNINCDLPHFKKQTKRLKKLFKGIY